MALKKITILGADSRLARRVQRNLNIRHNAKNILAIDNRESERRYGCDFELLDIFNCDHESLRSRTEHFLSFVCNSEEEIRFQKEKFG